MLYTMHGSSGLIEQRTAKNVGKGTETETHYQRTIMKTAEEKKLTRILTSVIFLSEYLNMKLCPKMSINKSER
jgi:hypothetical protein